MKPGPLLLSALWLAIVWPVVDRQQNTFRSSTDAVLVHVLVRQGSRSIGDLRCDEFELRDTGVLQSLESCDFEPMPLDVLIVADASQSVAGRISEQIHRASGHIRALLLPTDKTNTIGFASSIRRFGPGQSLSLDGPPDAGHTALTDALALALMYPAEAGRRRVAFVLTDGLDSNSFLDRELVQVLVDRADTVIHIFALAESKERGWMSLILDPNGREYFWPLRDIADRSGGQFRELPVQEDLSSALESAIAQVRTRYVLRYSPRNVALTGWHPISVRVARSGRYNISAKKGYQRGG